MVTGRHSTHSCLRSNLGETDRQKALAQNSIKKERGSTVCIRKRGRVYIQQRRLNTNYTTQVVCRDYTRKFQTLHREDDDGFFQVNVREMMQFFKLM